jgi:hypothetical protein
MDMGAYCKAALEIYIKRDTLMRCTSVSWYMEVRLEWTYREKPLANIDSSDMMPECMICYVDICVMNDKVGKSVRCSHSSEGCLVGVSIRVG